MAFIRIYADGSDVERRPLTGWTSIQYAIKAGVMTVYLKEATVSARLRTGEVYCVGDFNRNGTPINRMRPPRNDADALMWLFDYNNQARYHDKASFDRFVEEQCSTGQAIDTVWCEGNGYGFAVSGRPERVGVFPLAAYVDQSRVADKTLAKDFLKNWHYGIFYPQTYAEKFLQDRFGFTEEEAGELVRGKEFFCA